MSPNDVCLWCGHLRSKHWNAVRDGEVRGSCSHFKFGIIMHCPCGGFVEKKKH
jgi:hypothetical protein